MRRSFGFAIAICFLIVAIIFSGWLFTHIGDYRKAMPKTGAKSNVSAGAVSSSTPPDPDHHQVSTWFGPPKSGPRPHTTMPAYGLPLKDTMQDLYELAKEGDKQAATRLFNDARTCLWVNIAHNDADKWMTQTNGDGPVYQDEQQANDELRFLDGLQKEFDTEYLAGNLCDGISDEIQDGRVFWFTEIAALQGNMLAADCFVEGVVVSPNFPNDQAILEEYRSNALPIAEASIAAGNILMVQMLIDYYSPPVASMY
jgi:hypothetical protein